MIIFRSKVVDAIAYVLLIVGFVGLSTCWVIGRNGEERILGRVEFAHPTAQRPEPIEMKGRTFFVEPQYAHRYRFAQTFFFVFWAVAAVGGGIQSRRKIATWSTSRKTVQ
jgi:hypothetical protein